MIDKTYGKYDLECDSCGESEVNMDSFDDALNYAKENGWKIKKINGEWKHYCPDCNE